MCMLVCVLEYKHTCIPLTLCVCAHTSTYIAVFLWRLVVRGGAIKAGGVISQAETKLSVEGAVLGLLQSLIHYLKHTHTHYIHLHANR